MVFRLSVNIAYVFLICPFCQRKHHIHRKGKAFPEIYLLNVSNVVDIRHGRIASFINYMPFLYIPLNVHLKYVV